MHVRWRSAYTSRMAEVMPRDDTDVEPKRTMSTPVAAGL
jgi:hypothetical protein